LWHAPLGAFLEPFFCLDSDFKQSDTLPAWPEAGFARVCTQVCLQMLQALLVAVRLLY